MRYLLTLPAADQSELLLEELSLPEDDESEDDDPLSQLPPPPPPSLLPPLLQLSLFELLVEPLSLLKRTPSSLAELLLHVLGDHQLKSLVDEFVAGPLPSATWMLQ